MIAFWESESEGRKVFYQSITGEDTGEVVLGIPAPNYRSFGFAIMSSGSSRDFVANMDSPNFIVKFDRGRIVGIEQLDNHDQGSEGTSLSPLKPRFRNNAEHT